MDTPPLHSPARVLVVEDDEGIRSLLSAMLTLRGFDVVAAATGEEALRVAADGIDVVLLDLGLPGMTGLDVCRTLASHLPVIVVTGRAHSEDFRDAIKAGASDFVVKPFRRADLLAALGRALEPGGRSTATG
jgi:two-component system KDP operon response regulator KdpE